MTDNISNRNISILKFWHQVEFFEPASLPESGDYAPTRLFTRDTIHKAECLWPYKIQLGEKMIISHGYDVYFGVFNASEIADTLSEVLGSLQSQEDMILENTYHANGDSCFAKMSFSAHAEPLFDEISISTAPWAIGQIKKSGLDALNFDDFNEGLEELKHTLSNFSSNLSLREDFNTSQLSSSALIEILEIFYAWAGFTPKNSASKPVILIRGHYKTYPQKDPLTKELEVNEVEILNSFYGKDIERAIQSLQNGEQANALASYLTPVNESKRVNLYSAEGRCEISQLLHPKYINAGHWLDNESHSLSLMQQFAINCAFDNLHDGGCFSVNGPPGTGKTTLLKDVFANNLVQRARVLQGLDKAKGAFKKAVSIKFKSASSVKVSQLIPELTGFEMIVASSNNAAVENLSKDLPKLDSLGDNWIDEDGSPKVMYLRGIARKIALKNSSGYDEPNSKNDVWGLFSCATGKSANRKSVAYQITGKTNVEGLNSIWEWRDEKENKPLSFQCAKEGFKEIDAAVAGRIKKLTQYISAYKIMRSLNEQIFTENHQKKHTQALQEFKDAESAISNLKSDLSNKKQLALSFQQDKGLLQEAKPSLWHALITMGIFSYPKALKEYQLNINAINQQLLACSAKLRTLKSSESKLQNELAQSQAKLELAKKSLEESKQEWQRRVTIFNKLQQEFPNAKEPEDLSELELDEWQINGIWKDFKLNHLRSQLFAASLTLHEAWLYEVMQTGVGFGGNVMAMSHLLSGKKIIDKQHALSIWQSLFMIVPVISSTFSSISSQFKEVNSGAFGWLLIDEAGQATPQAPVGALWRCKRAIIVGDPVQIEPVMKTSEVLIDALFDHSNLDPEELISPGKVSAQGLADQANKHGAYASFAGENLWIGAPLRVHRRCFDPMFTIANEIAYNGKMVFGLPKVKVPVSCMGFKQSAWINVVGKVTHKQVTPEHIAVLEGIISTIAQKTNELPNVFIISPFKAMAQKMSGELFYALRKLQLFCDSDIKEWCKKHIGTVHTFQGKENEVVFFVLGCDKSKLGAANWVASKPNILNVALTRSKHHFIVIGEKDLWARLSYFDELQPLPVMSVEDFHAQINS